MRYTSANHGWGCAGVFRAWGWFLPLCSLPANLGSQPLAALWGGKVHALRALLTSLSVTDEAENQSTHSKGASCLTHAQEGALSRSLRASFWMQSGSGEMRWEKENMKLNKRERASEVGKLRS